MEFDVKVEQQFIQTIPHLISSQNIFDTTWELQFSTKEDMRPLVFDFAKTHGMKILNLSRKNKSLEQLFKELTKN